MRTYGRFHGDGWGRDGGHGRGGDGHHQHGHGRHGWLRGDAGDNLLEGGPGANRIWGGAGDDTLHGGAGRDWLQGGCGDDILEGGPGDDRLAGGRGDDTLLAFSWGGEPVPAQDATGQVNAGEPVSDRDSLNGGEGADRFEFRWLIDAKAEIIARHTNAKGNIDYSMNGVAGENGNVHDHWVETIGVKVVTDYDAAEGDTLVFKGHTVQLDTLSHEDYNDDQVVDTVLTFISNQGGAGAHDQDEVGTVVILGALLDRGDISVNAGVFYGVEEPYSATG